ncbi:MAG: Card1-like endonuclease domain-containing protein [Roseiflexus sp.]
MMHTTVALLVLIGGRQTPNVLSAQFLRPDIIAPIASREAMHPDGAWEKVKPVLKQLSPQVLDPRIVDAFDLNAIRKQCAAAMDDIPNARWVCNITCATTIMSIGAYEEGRARNASVWYFDTAGRRVVTLAGQPPNGDPYRLSVEHYLQIYDRSVQPMQPPSQSQVMLAQQMAQAPDEAIAFRDILRTAAADAKFIKPRRLMTQPLTSTMVRWCEQAQNAGFISAIRKLPNGYEIEQMDGALWDFVNGIWLEIYAWNAAQRAGCFDDCRLSIIIPAPDGRSSNQIDLAMTHAASLLIAECKTESQPFRTQHLDQLRAITSIIGGSFVGALFITARSQHKANPDAFTSFCDQARARQIVVITGDRLTQLPDILKREAASPTFPRG